MGNVTLRINNTNYIVRCNSVTTGWKNTNSGKPAVNSSTPYVKQTGSFDNPIYTISNIMLTGEEGTLTYPALLTMAKNQYIGTNPIYLKFYDGTTQVPDSTGTTGTYGIKVVLDSFNKNNNHLESKEATIPTLSITLSETA